MNAHPAGAGPSRAALARPSRDETRTGRKERTMSTMDVAQKFYALAVAHKDEEALKTLFSPDAVSVEAADMPGLPRELRGLPAIEAKGKWWRENNELHSAKVEGPYPNGDRFAIRFSYDITQKATGKRVQMDEVALYTVSGDKIVREEFFYPT
jgi:ketosteroid isomerase-like protein